MALVIKNPPANAGNVRDTGSVIGPERSPGGGQGNPLQYSCLENPMMQRSLLGYSLWGHKESDMTVIEQGRGGTRILTQICPIPKALFVSYTLKTLIFVMFLPICLLLNLIHICVLNHFSLVRLFETLWAVAHKAPLSLGFSRQEYWSGLLCPPPGESS